MADSTDPHVIGRTPLPDGRGSDGAESVSDRYTPLPHGRGSDGAESVSDRCTPLPHGRGSDGAESVSDRSSHADVRIERGSPHDPQVAALFALSDAYAAALYPAESNHLVDADALAQAHVIFGVARRGEQILGCGASVLYADADAGPAYAEIKRMFVLEEARGLRLGERILAYLEEQTAARGVRTLRLETGIDSHPARRLYERCGYRRIGPFADYWDDPLSVFYEKNLP